MMSTKSDITLAILIASILALFSNQLVASPAIFTSNNSDNSHSEDIKPITPKKYSDILGSKEHPLDAQLVEFLSLIDDSPEKALQIFPRVSGQKHNFNAAEHYLFYLAQAKMSLQQGAYNKVFNWAERPMVTHLSSCSVFLSVT